MKVHEVFALDEFMKSRKHWIMQQNPTVREIRSQAETELGFKCPSDPITSCMKRHEIPVRRNKAEAERMLMQGQIEELTELIVDLVAHGSLPPQMLLKFRERGRNLNGRVMNALDRRYDQTKAAT